MSSSTLFERCAIEHGGDEWSSMLQCVSNGVEESAAKTAAESASTLDEWLLVLAGALVFFMQVSRIL
jgi:hypothetical protein